MFGRVGLGGVGFVAPGLADRDAFARHLHGAPLAPVEDWRPSPASLPPRQARRLSAAIALAIAAAEQIGTDMPPGAGWVFASSLGEGETLKEILGQISGPEIMVQPLRFQNAVHNAAQGQWSILAGAEGPATSIAAQDETAGAGLLKAAMQVLLEGLPVGLVIFDAPLPPPLHEKQPLGLPMAAALVLKPEPSESACGWLALELDRDAPPTDPAESGASPLLTESGNPVRFLLPLLARIERGDARPVVLGLPGGGRLKVCWRGAGDAG